MTIAVFLDRDGTINQEKGYLRDLNDLVLIPGAAQAIRQLNDAGLRVIVTTNQSGPARGFYGEDHVRALNARLELLLQEEAGATLDAVFYSPYLPHGTVPEYAKASHCRKPDIGMIEAAVEQFPDIELSKSYVMGDKASDVDFAYNAGCRSVLLKTGYGEAVLAGRYQVLKQQPHLVCDDIVAAAAVVLSELKRPGAASLRPEEDIDNTPNADKQVMM